MEYASEMVVKAELNGLKIAEVPTTLCKDGRSRPPHLRSFRDGWRHLKFLLMYAPDWLLLYPGLLFLALGLMFGAVLVIKQITISHINFSIHTLLYCACSMIIGVSILQLYLIVKVYAYNHGFLPPKNLNWAAFNEDIIIAAGGVLVLAGIALSIMAVEVWKTGQMGNLEPERIMRIVIPAVSFLIIGIQSICTGFVVGVMKVKTGATDEPD